MYSELTRLSVRNIRNQSARSWLTAIGVVIGIMAVVALISLGQALEYTVEREFEDLGTETIFITEGEGLQGFFVAGGLDDQDLEVIRNARGVDTAGAGYYGSTTATFQGQNERVPVIGIPTDESQTRFMSSQAMSVDTGRNLRDTDQNNILVGGNLADDYFDSSVGLRSQIRAGGTDLRVVGIMEMTGDPEFDNAIVMPIDRARDLFEGGEEVTNYIVAFPQQGLEPRDVADNIEEAMRRDRGQAPGDEDFTVSTSDDLLETFSNVIGSVQAVVIGLASISLLVGGIGIMNTMYMSVTERTQEIGVMKAIGAQKKQIKTIFLLESGLIGLLGGIVGIILGLGISELAIYIINFYVDIEFVSTYSITPISSVLLFSFLIGMLSGYLPARQAAQLEPVEALREE